MWLMRASRSPAVHAALNCCRRCSVIAGSLVLGIHLSSLLGGRVRPGRDRDGAGALVEMSEVMPGDLGDHQAELLTPLLTVGPPPLPSIARGVAEQCGVVGPQPGEHADEFGGLGMGKLRPELLLVSGVCGFLFGEHEPEPES